MSTPNESKTQMVAKPQAQTQMVAPEKKKVSIRALRPFQLGDRVVEPGEEIEVTEEEAAEFCKPFPGFFGFSGERSTEDALREKNTVTRAEKLN